MLALSLAVVLSLPAAILTPGTLVVQKYVRVPNDFAEFSTLAVVPDGVTHQLRPPQNSDGWGETWIAAPPNRIFSISTGDISVTTDGWKTARTFYRAAGYNVQALVPMRSGHYLVAQISPEHKSEQLVELTDAGAVVATYPLPFRVHGEIPNWPSNVQMDLLADQCTLVYTGRARLDTEFRIQRYNVCTRQDLPDLTTLPLSFSDFITAIRQLPGGDFVIAGEREVRRYSRDGLLLTTYPFPAYSFSLTADGSGFWAEDSQRSSATPVPAHIRRIDFANPFVVAFEPNLGTVHGVNGLAVIGEWRAATYRAPAKSRSVPRR